MLKKTITFPDLDGNEVTDDFYFNLTEAEAIELEVNYPGGLSSYVESLVEGVDPELPIGKAPRAKEIVALVKDLIHRTVGQRSDDGRYFDKSEEIRQRFMNSNAYSVMFMELLSNAEMAAQFFNDVMPAKIRDKVESPTVEDTRPLYVRENRRATQEEFKKMTPAEQVEAFAFQPTP